MVCENSWGLLTTDFRSSKKILSFSKKDFTFFWKAYYFLDVIYLIRSNLKATLTMFSSTRIKIYPLVHLSPISPTLTDRSATVFLRWVKASSPKSCLCFHSFQNLFSIQHQERSSKDLTIPHWKTPMPLHVLQSHSKSMTTSISPQIVLAMLTEGAPVLPGSLCLRH